MQHSVKVNGGFFHLSTENSSYVMKVLDTGHLAHIWYGKRFPDNAEGIGNIVPDSAMAAGSEVSYDEDHPFLNMADVMLECSAPGKGDRRTPSVIVRYGKGLTTLDFLYDSYTLTYGRAPLPRPRAEGRAEDAESLIITLKDRVLPIKLELEYTVFRKEDTIVRTARLINETSETIALEKLSSLMLDLPDTDWDIITLSGAWAREKMETRQHVSSGKLSFGSSSGFSSNASDPWLCLARPETTGHSGEAIASTLIYSGSHEETVEVSPYGMMRIGSGINPETFSWPLSPGESFMSPDCILTWSGQGIEGTSDNMRRFISEHVIRSGWKNKERPILLNNWEATYFWFDEEKIHSLIDEAAYLGMELFVLDDGWFGKRDSDRSSLGDWEVYEKKLPHGMKGLSDYAHGKGLMFGIWTEPEMVSIDSDLYRKHPEWMVAIPGREPSPGRHQFFLDMTREDVRAYLLEALSKIVEDGNVDYMKWDMNRTMSDVFSSTLPDNGMFMHSYIEGLYDLLEKFTSKYPGLLLESCASGGNRYDAGMLAFSPQIWTSDDTDAAVRTLIQKGTLRWSPQSAMGAHVSAVPNHQSLRTTDLGTRFAVASMGCLGYELDVTKLTADEKDEIKSQTAFYKKWRHLLQYGKLSFIDTRDSNTLHWAVTEKDAIIAVTFQYLNRVNTGRRERLILPMAESGKTYKITERNTAENLWSVTVSGDILKGPGIELPPKFTGSGNEGYTRRMGDFSARMYAAETI